MIAAADNNNVGQELAARILIDGRHVSKTRLHYGRKNSYQQVQNLNW